MAMLVFLIGGDKDSLKLIRVVRILDVSVMTGKSTFFGYIFSVALTIGIIRRVRWNVNNYYQTAIMMQK